MDIKKIDIGKKYSKKIAMDSTAAVLFKEFEGLNEVILDFSHVEFVSRSFAQEYIFLRYHSHTCIIEQNMNDFIKGLFEVVEEDFKDTCLP